MKLSWHHPLDRDEAPAKCYLFTFHGSGEWIIRILPIIHSKWNMTWTSKSCKPVQAVISLEQIDTIFHFFFLTLANSWKLLYEAFHSQPEWSIACFRDTDISEGKRESSLPALLRTLAHSSQTFLNGWKWEFPLLPSEAAEKFAIHMTKVCWKTNSNTNARQTDKQIPQREWCGDGVPPLLCSHFAWLSYSSR